jgi:hypothetical protein
VVFADKDVEADFRRVDRVERDIDPIVLARLESTSTGKVERPKGVTVPVERAQLSRRPLNQTSSARLSDATLTAPVAAITAYVTTE